MSETSDKLVPQPTDKQAKIDAIEKFIAEAQAQPPMNHIKHDAPVAPGSPIPYSTNAAPAIGRCHQAWQQAFDAYMKKNARKDGTAAELYARDEADAAYRAAMPQLSGHIGIRDFVACLAHGVLIGAIPPERAGQLIYAAQTAGNLLARA